MNEAKTDFLYPCPCCGYKVLLEKPPGTYLVCPICFWEDDGDNFGLRRAQRNFIEFGACGQVWIEQVRHPTEQDARVPNWQSLDMLAVQRSLPCLHTLPLGEACASSMVISPNGDRLFAASYDSEDGHNYIRVWDLKTGQLVHTFPGNSSNVGSLYIAISQNGKTLASIVGYDCCWIIPDGIIVWDVLKGQRIRAIQTHGAHDLEISPDGQFLATGTLWNLQTGKKFHGLLGEYKAFTDCIFSSDSTKLIACDKDGTITVWDLQSGKQLHSQQEKPGESHKFALHPAGQICVHSNSDGSIIAWELQTGRKIRSFHDDNRGKISELCFSSDGRILISVRRDPIKYRDCIKGWNFHNSEALFAHEVTRSEFGTLAVSPNEPILAFSCEDNVLEVLNLLTGEVIGTCEHDDIEDDIRSICFDPQGLRMITDSYKSIKVWKLGLSDNSFRVLSYR